MHMPPPATEGSILEANPDDLAKRLLLALATDRWPVPPNAFPSGSALVGGAVRDGLLGRLSATPDLDLVVPEHALKQTQQMAKEYGGVCVVLDEQRDMARLVLKGWTIDLARQEGAHLEADLMRRDYRLNAIALAFHPIPQLVDPTGGIDDLKAQRIKAVAEANLIDDPLRLLRGIRLAAQLNFDIDPGTWSLLLRHRSRLPQAAPERIQAELIKLVEAAGADQALGQLQNSQLLAPWEEQSPDGPASTHWPELSEQAALLTPEERVQALPLLRLTRLLSDRGIKELRFSRRQLQRCQTLRHWLQRDDHQAYASLQPEERLRLHRNLEADLPALILHWPLALQDRWLKRWRDPQDPLFHPRPPLDGNTLQNLLQIGPGPQLGQLLHHLTLEQAFGRLEGQEQALESARHWLRQEHGRTKTQAQLSSKPPRCD